MDITNTKPQAAQELTELYKRGATEKQLSDYIREVGYEPSDFNVDNNGVFRPMVQGTGNAGSNLARPNFVTPVPTDNLQSTQYYEDLTASASVPDSVTKTRSITETTTTTFQQTTGGGSTTIYKTPAQDTAASLSYKQQAKTALDLQRAYAMNPEENKKALDKRLAEGRITQEQYDEIFSLSPAERRAKSVEYAKAYETARDAEVNNQVSGPASIVTTPSTTTSSITVNSETVRSQSTTTITNGVLESNVTIEVIDGETFQVTTNANGEKTYTPNTPGFTAGEFTVDPASSNINTASVSGRQPVAEFKTQAFIDQEPAAREEIDTASIVRTPAELTDDALQEARFEQERLNALAAQQPRRDPSVPPTITQDAPPGVAGPYDDNGNLLSGWVEGPNGTVAYVGFDAAQNGGAGLTTAPPVLATSILPYDDDGNLQPGWKLGADGLPFRDPNYPGGGPPILPERSPFPVDDDGNLQPGWILVDGEYVHDPDYDQVDLGSEAVGNIKKSKSQGITGDKSKAQGSAQATSAPIKNKPDWRVRLQLAPQANYLYKDPRDPGILKPLQATNGVLFPYVPAVSVNYNASYDAQSLAHTNYKILQYGNSSVDNVQVTGEFTAQTTEEANYLLAVIHFFRTITKMFYGQDNNPKRGTPPPLTYLTGFGEFQYSQHPLVITTFNYQLPTDVDYIRADSSLLVPGTSSTPSKAANGFGSSSTNRIAVGRVPQGGYPLAPQWARPTSTSSTTYVPTKMSISFSGIPVVTRADISRVFSVQDYARGTLTRGKTNVRGRGFW